MTHAAQERTHRAATPRAQHDEAHSLLDRDPGDFMLRHARRRFNAEGLQALREKPENVENWQGPYVSKEIGNDPWNHPYVYHFPGEHGDEPDIISYGLDGAPGGEDFSADIVSWKN